MRRFTITAALFLLLQCFGPWGTPASEPPASADQPPLVIPHPQMIETRGSENVTVGQDGRNVTRVLLAADDDLLIEAKRSYPDGEVYACFGGTVGCCLANEALSRRIAERYKPLVRDWEPGSIYLHHIDVAKYGELQAIWKHRCPIPKQDVVEAVGWT